MNTERPEKPTTVDHVRECGIAAAGVVAATLIRLPLTPLLGARAAFITYFPAIVFGAWVGGWVGGLTAILLSALAAVFFFISPTHALLIKGHTDQVSLVVFVLVGLAISALGDAQRRQARALAVSEARQRQMLEQANEGVMTVDAEDRIVVANARMAEMLGYPPGGLHGLTVYDILFPEDAEAARRRRRERRQGVAEQYELRLRRRDGQAVWAVANVTVIREADQYAGTFSLLTDITERKRAEAELAAAYARETLINRIGEAIRGTTDPDRIQGAAVQALGEALGVDRAYYSVLDQSRDRSWNGQDFRRADLPSLAGEYRISDFGLDPADYYPDGQTLVLPDAHAPDWPTPMAEALRTLRVRSAISVPLFDAGRLVGTLAVAMADQTRDWTAEEVALVEAVAVQTRAALEASRAQEREHRIATALQEALQPPVPEHVLGLRVASFLRPALDEAAVGGDFYDVFALDKGLYALVIGDVSGKGLAAAAQLATVRNMLRSVLYQYRDPAQAVTSLNAILTAHDLLLGFVTAFVGIYDAGAGVVTYASCGHEPALLRRAATGAVETLEPTGMPLGAAEGAVYSQDRVVLAAGDRLLLYTDGISEAGPNRRAMLGTGGLTRLVESLPADGDVQAAAAALVAQVSDYARGIFRDDVCMLLMERC